MNLSSDDVRNKKFSLGRKGYRESEVDEFLDSVIAAIEERDTLVNNLRSSSAAPEPRQTAPDVSGHDNHPQQSASADIETATRLLSLAERTAEQYIADAETHAAETLSAAEDRAKEITTAAELAAATVLHEAEAERRQILGNLRYEQHRLHETMNEIQAARSQARADLEEYLTDLLVKVRDASGGPSGIRALTALT
jgi:DivIVA domain-containing protein